ncbi:hypothetical protein EVAR_26439_1 [Eumeta japonica]|uniref:Uncharacterized protein n=1 Tax=Eumeta variegata TaxID=151549 RepID=A0A4C1VSI0_EUMVA|nr:hypothetical protein EVAR_26439_1 [Eumeta japonica]
MDPFIEPPRYQKHAIASLYWKFNRACGEFRSGTALVPPRPTAGMSFQGCRPLILRRETLKRRGIRLFYPNVRPNWLVSPPVRYNSKLTTLTLPSVIFEPKFRGSVRNLVYADGPGQPPRRQELRHSRDLKIRNSNRASRRARRAGVDVFNGIPRVYWWGVSREALALLPHLPPAAPHASPAQQQEINASR